jgi:hypothetical protein
MGHSHTEDRTTYYLEQLCTIAVCGALGGVAVLLYKQEMLKYILIPQFFRYVLLSGIALLVLVALRGVLLWRSVGLVASEHRHGQGQKSDHGPLHDHGRTHDHHHDGAGPHDHDHEHCCGPEGDHADACGHGHEHGWNPWRYIVLLLPIVLYLLGLPNAALTKHVNIDVDQTSAVGMLVENCGMRILKDSKRDLLQVVSITPDGPAQKAGLKVDDFILQIARAVDSNGEPLPNPEVLPVQSLSLAEAVNKLRGKPQTKVKLRVERGSSEPLQVELVRNADLLDLQFKELERAAYTPAQRQYYAGRMGRLRGQFMPGRNDHTFSLVRIKITCCAADAIPLNVVIQLDPNSKEGVSKNIRPQQWVQVTGEIDFLKRRDRDEYVSVLRVASPQDVRETDPDPNPYIQ